MQHYYFHYCEPLFQPYRWHFSSFYQNNIMQAGIEPMFTRDKCQAGTLVGSLPRCVHMSSILCTDLLSKDAFELLNWPLRVARAATLSLFHFMCY